MNKEKVDMQKNRKEYFITELNMGIDGLESYTDYSGPFTLAKARNIMEKLMKNLKIRKLVLFSEVEIRSRIWFGSDWDWILS